MKKKKVKTYTRYQLQKRVREAYKKGYDKGVSENNIYISRRGSTLTKGY